MESDLAIKAGKLLKRFPVRVELYRIAMDVSLYNDCTWPA